MDKIHGARPPLSDCTLPMTLSVVRQGRWQCAGATRALGAAAFDSLSHASLAAVSRSRPVLSPLLPLRSAFPCPPVVPAALHRRRPVQNDHQRRRREHRHHGRDARRPLHEARHGCAERPRRCAQHPLGAQGDGGCRAAHQRGGGEARAPARRGAPARPFTRASLCFHGRGGTAEPWPEHRVTHLRRSRAPPLTLGHPSPLPACAGRPASAPTPSRRRPESHTSPSCGRCAREARGRPWCPQILPSH